MLMLMSIESIDPSPKDVIPPGQYVPGKKVINHGLLQSQYERLATLEREQASLHIYFGAPFASLRSIRRGRHIQDAMHQLSQNILKTKYALEATHFNSQTAKILPFPIVAIHNDTLSAEPNEATVLAFDRSQVSVLQETVLDQNQTILENIMLYNNTAADNPITIVQDS